MNPEQQSYYNEAAKLAYFNAPKTTAEEKQVFPAWYPHQIDLDQRPEGFITNRNMFWSALCLHGYNGRHTPITADNLTVFKNSSELRPLLVLCWLSLKWRSDVFR